MSKSIREAIQYCLEHPASAEPLDMPVWEHVSRALIEHANNPNPKVRGAMARATKAQAMILDRTVGKRKPGSRPVSPSKSQVEFEDLTAGAIESEAKL